MRSLAYRKDAEEDQVARDVDGEPRLRDGQILPLNAKLPRHIQMCLGLTAVESRLEPVVVCMQESDATQSCHSSPSGTTRHKS